MSHPVRRLALGLLSTALIATLGATSALAAGPTRTVEPLDFTTEFPAGTRCAFDVSRTFSGTLATTTFTGADGLTTTTFLYRGGKIEYTNPANGKSVSTVLAGPAVYIDNGDGTTTLRIPGNSQLYTAPGIGFIVGNAGLSIKTIDTTTEDILSVDKLAGHQDGLTFPAFCVGLE
jgi:hypothetical protein